MNKEKIPTGCHDCEHGGGIDFEPEICNKLPSTNCNVGKYVRNKTFHPKCPENYEMYHKLKQL